MDNDVIRLLDLSLSARHFSDNGALENLAFEQNWVIPSKESFSQPALEIFKSAFVQKIHQRLTDMVLAVQNKLEQRRNKKNKKPVNPNHVIYPKATPAEAAKFHEDGDYLLRILRGLLQDYTPSQLDSEEGYRHFIQQVEKNLTSDRGWLPLVEIKPDNDHFIVRVSLDDSPALQAIGKRELSTDAVNGWREDDLIKARAGLDNIEEQYLFTLKRIVGKINGINNPPDSEWYDRAMSALLTSLRVAQSLHDRWAHELVKTRLRSES